MKVENHYTRVNPNFPLSVRRAISVWWEEGKGLV